MDCDVGCGCAGVLTTGVLHYHLFFLLGLDPFAHLPQLEAVAIVWLSGL